MSPNQRHHCHKLLKETAVEMAGAMYDELMRDNDWWRVWRESHPGMSRRALHLLFIRQTWPGLIGQARATLGRLLAQPINPLLKEQIHEALMLDNSLPRGKVSSLQR